MSTDLRTGGPRTGPCACGHYWDKHSLGDEGPCREKGCDCPHWRKKDDVHSDAYLNRRCLCRHTYGEHAATDPHRCLVTGCGCIAQTEAIVDEQRTYLGDELCTCGHPYRRHTKGTKGPCLGNSDGRGPCPDSCQRFLLYAPYDQPTHDQPNEGRDTMSNSFSLQVETHPAGDGGVRALVTVVGGEAGKIGVWESATYEGDADESADVKALKAGEQHLFDALRNLLSSAT